jgi:hypothetical protein
MHRYKNAEGYFARLLQLAREVLVAPSVLNGLLNRIIVEQNAAVSHFGHALGDADTTFSLWPILLATFKASGDARKPNLLAGYFCSMFIQMKSRWENESLALLKDEVLKNYACALVLGTGMTEPILDRICDLVERSEIPDKSLEEFAFARQRGPITLERCLRFISWCLSLSRPTLVRNAIDTAHSIFCSANQPPPIPEHPILELLIAREVLQQGQRDSHYNWAELAKRYIVAYPQYSQKIFESVLLKFSDSDVAIGFVYSESRQVLMALIRQDPRGTWNVVAQVLELPDAKRKWEIAHWLGPGFIMGQDTTECPLSIFKADDVLAWVAADPKERASLIIRECPKTFDMNSGALTRQMLIRFGDQDAVRSALSANFGSGTYTGPSSEYCRKTREKMRKWLASETEQPVINWLQNSIGSLDQQIKQEEIWEERQF